MLKNQLIYGGYPYLDQVGDSQEKQQYLKSIVDNYLFRDVLQLKEINQPEILRKLTTLLAFQIGSEVSLNELSQRLGIDTKTVDKYIYLLKQGFVVLELKAFSKNLRNEISKSKKYYFWDLGIRNSIINQFIDHEVRLDIGALWENFLILERIKKNEYSRQLSSNFFWRTYEGSEIDYIEQDQSTINAFEFKWNPFKKAKTPKAFMQAYNAQVQLINRENYLSFI